MSVVRQFITPEGQDVLCGRGASCQQHPGNRLLRDLIKNSLPKYASADNKGDKSSILRDIVRAILQNGGRFLKKDPQTDCYYEAGLKAARDKVGHCLREAMSDSCARSMATSKKVTLDLSPRIESNPGTTIVSESTSQTGSPPLNPGDGAASLPTIISDMSGNVTHVLQEYQQQPTAVAALASGIPTSISVASNATISTVVWPGSNSGENQVVDALYELPTEGEWEQLILPQMCGRQPEPVDWVPL